MLGGVTAVELFQRSLIFTGPVLREEWFIITSDRSGKFQVNLDSALVSDCRARLNYPVEKELKMTARDYGWEVEYPTDKTPATLVINFAFHDRVEAYPSKIASMHEAQRVKIEAQPVSIKGKEQSLHLLVPQQVKLLGLQCGGQDQTRQSPTSHANDPTIPKGVSRYSCTTSDSLKAQLEMTSKIPMLRIKRLKRTLRLCPWTGRLYISDDYEWEHFGHEIGGFSRAEYLKLLMQPALGRLSQAMNLLPTILPAKATVNRLYDEVGLLLNQQLNRRAISEKYHAVDVQPRYPLAAKYWNTRYLLDYYLADPPNALNLLVLPLDIPVDELEVQVASDSLPITIEPIQKCRIVKSGFICHHLTMEHGQLPLSLKFDASLFGRIKVISHRFYNLMLAFISVLLTTLLIRWMMADPRLFKRQAFAQLTARRRKLIKGGAKIGQIRQVESMIVSLFANKASPSMQAINLRKVYDEQTSLLSAGGETDLSEIEAMAKRVEQTELRILPTL